MAEEQAAGAAQDDQVQQQFTMQRMYTKDISFESPATPFCPCTFLSLFRSCPLSWRRPVEGELRQLV